MVGAIVPSSTDAAGQEAVVGPARRVAEHPDVELEGALSRSYSSRVYFRKLHHALRMHWSTSMDKSTLLLTFPLRCMNLFVWLYTNADTFNMPTSYQ